MNNCNIDVKYLKVLNRGPNVILAYFRGHDTKNTDLQNNGKGGYKVA